MELAGSADVDGESIAKFRLLGEEELFRLGLGGRGIDRAVGSIGGGGAMSGRATAASHGVPAAPCQSLDHEPLARGGSGVNAGRAWAMPRLNCAAIVSGSSCRASSASNLTPVGDCGPDLLS
jgi:hypothetical protein